MVSYNDIVYVVLGDQGTISLVERNGATKVFKLKQMFSLVPLKVILTHECLDQNSSNLWTERYQSRLYTIIQKQQRTREAGEAAAHPKQNLGEQSPHVLVAKNTCYIHSVKLNLHLMPSST